MNLEDAAVPFLIGGIAGYLVHSMMEDADEVGFTDDDLEYTSNYPSFSPYSNPYDPYFNPTMPSAAVRKCPTGYARQKRCFIPRGYNKKMCIARCKRTTAPASKGRPYTCPPGALLRKLRVKNPKTNAIVTVGSYCRLVTSCAGIQCFLWKKLCKAFGGTGCG